MSVRVRWFETGRMRLGFAGLALLVIAAGLTAAMMLSGGEPEATVPAEPMECDLSGPTPTPIAPRPGFSISDAREQQFGEELVAQQGFGGRYLEDGVMVTLITGEPCSLQQLFAKYEMPTKGIVFRPVEYSYPDLYALQLRIVEDMEAWRAFG